MHDSRDCEYHHYERVSNGRQAIDGATVFCHVPPSILCVKGKEDIARLRRLGFNKFIINTNWDDKVVGDFGVDNSDIMLELSNDHQKNIDGLENNLRTWIANGFAGGMGGDFYAVFLNEPSHIEYDTFIQGAFNYFYVASIVHKVNQKVALGEYMVYSFYATMDPFTGSGGPWDGAPNEGILADMYFYTGYEGPWSAPSSFIGGESDQRPYWIRLSRIAGSKPAFPFIQLSHTSTHSDDKFQIEDLTDVDYLDTYLKTAKKLFNGAVAYPFEIHNEFVLDLIRICEDSSSSEHPSDYSHLSIPTDVYDPQIVRLNEHYPNVIQKCICQRKTALGHREHLAYITTSDPAATTASPSAVSCGCSKEDIDVLQKAYCDLFWQRLELFSAAAERQGLLKTVYTDKLTVYHCAKGDCRECAGTDPFHNPDLWQTTRLPLCQRLPPDLTLF